MRLPGLLDKLAGYIPIHTTVITAAPPGGVEVLGRECPAGAGTMTGNGQYTILYDTHLGTGTYSLISVTVSRTTI